MKYGALSIGVFSSNILDNTTDLTDLNNNLIHIIIQNLYQDIINYIQLFIYNAVFKSLKINNI